jgi:hypothetical protein
MAKPQYSGPWQKIRKTILERDSHLCQIRGPKCTTTATAVDHIIPVSAGGPWYDPNNLRAACTPCNNWRITQTKNDQWRTARTLIHLITGPPGAGKTTRAHQLKNDGDLLIDYDQIAEALGATPHNSDHIHEATNAARNAILRKLRRGEINVGRVWLVSANPHAERILPHHTVELIDPGIDEVKRRAILANRPGRFITLIDDWYQQRGEGSQGEGSREW